MVIHWRPNTSKKEIQFMYLFQKKCCGADLFRPVAWGNRMRLVSGDAFSNPDPLID